MGKLSEKQKMFCKEYIVDLNGTQAAIRAGYSKKTARTQAAQHLAKRNIQQYVLSLIEKRSRKVEISAEYVLNNIIEVGERCMQRVPVMIRDGKEMVQKQEYNDLTEQWEGVWEFKEGGALKAQELLGKHLKLFGADSEDLTRPTVLMPTIKIGETEITFDIGSEPDSS